MVPRRIGDVSCGENHTMWQTQRRHEEGSSHPCSLQQWSHQRLLTFFPFVLPRLWHFCPTVSANSQTNEFINHAFTMCLDRKTSAVFEAKIYRWVTKHILTELTRGARFTVWACSCEAKHAVWEETLWWWLESTARLWLCSYVPSPCLRRQTALLTKGGRKGCGGGWWCGMVEESRQR